VIATNPRVPARRAEPRRWTFAELAAEVLSPGTRRRDRLDKRDLYEQHGVKEYWLIDPEARTVEVLSLERGQYQLLGRWDPDGQATSRLLKGFKVPVREVFEDVVRVKRVKNGGRDPKTAPGS
jgi:Uma2 family endonuclease